MGTKLDSLCSRLIKEKFVELALRRASEGGTPEFVPDLVLDPLLNGGGPP